MAIKTYPVLGRLLHDGKLYDPVAKQNVTIDLDDDEVEDIPEHLLGEPIAADPKVDEGKKSDGKPAKS